MKVKGGSGNEGGEQQQASEMGWGEAWAALDFVCVYMFQMSPPAVTKGSVGFRTRPHCSHCSSTTVFRENMK